MPLTSLSPLSAVRGAVPTPSIDREALRQRVQEAGGSAQASVSVAATALNLAADDAAPTASLIWSPLPQDRVVPPDNTYGPLVSVAWGSGPKTELPDSPATEPQRVQAWATAPAGDAISRQMARNEFRSTERTLASQWNGLGSALLSLASAPSTSPLNYRQTLLSAADPTQPLKEQFDRLQKGATTVTLQIKTRSGQTVDLQIAVNRQPGTLGEGSSQGLQVSVSSTGPLSETERRALAALSQGLEDTLAGLGDADAPEIDLSGLLAYDRSAFSQLNLDIQNPTASAALGSFALHLGDGGSSLSYQGAAGKMDLRLDATPPFQTGSAQQRQAAIAQQLQLIDAAADRSHADEKLVALFKSSFSQLHGAAPTAAGDTPVGETSAVDAGLVEKVQPLLSGLVDFEASFSGDFSRDNRWGNVNEQGQAQYAISQRTTVDADRKEKTAGIIQTQSEQVQSNYVKARYDGALDILSGNFDRYAIKDHRTVSTLISAADNKLTSAVRSTDRQQLETHETVVKHRVVDRKETPSQQHLLTLLM